MFSWAGDDRGRLRVAPAKKEFGASELLEDGVDEVVSKPRTPVIRTLARIAMINIESENE